MTQVKYKMTGCARFFIFLVFIVPIAYFGAQYLMDNGIIDTAKEKIGEARSVNKPETKTEASTGLGAEQTSRTDLSEVQNKLEQLIKVVDLQKDKINDLELSLKDKDGLILRLQKELDQRVNNTPSSSETNSQGNSNNQTIQELLKEADRALKKNGN